MNSVTYGIGCMLAALVVHISSAEYHLMSVINPTISKYPYIFSYYKSYDSLLVMHITLENIPPSVTNVTVIHHIYDHSGWTHHRQPQWVEHKVSVDNKRREGRFLILERLTHSQTWIVLALYVGTEIWYKIKLVEGREPYAGYYWDAEQSQMVYYYDNKIYTVSNDCLDPNMCELNLDLKKACEEQEVSTNSNEFKCQQEESQYVCSFVRTATKPPLKLYQTYANNSITGAVYTIKEAQMVNLFFKFELFDYNTSFKLEEMWSQEKAKLIASSYVLSGTAKDISEASDVTILKYTETTDVQFSCEQYSNNYTRIFVGVINTTDNKITTHNTTIMKGNKFKKADNGTMLCCMVYAHNSRGWNVSITRSVQNKTLLIYQSRESTPNESGENSMLVSGDEWWVYLIPTVLGIAVLMMTIYIVMKLRWHKACTNTPPGEEPLELENNPTSAQVLYANLDFDRNENRTVNQTEESQYANIVGVLHPL